MEEDRLREWVEEKLESGVSEDRVRKSLENTGHDPSIVDEVKQEENPFQGSDTEVEEHPFEDRERDNVSSGDEGFDFSDDSVETEDNPEKLEENTGDEKDGFEFSTEEKQQETDEETDKFQDFDDTDEGALEKARIDRSNDNQDETRSSSSESDRDEEWKFTDANEEETGLREKIPDFRQRLPDLSFLNNLPLKSSAAIIALILISAGIYSFIPDDAVERATQPVEDFAGGFTSPPENECPDVGVLIRSLSSSEGVTFANVEVSRGEAEVVLEVFRSGKKVGQTKKTVGGEDVMSVNEVGDRASFHPVGCERFISVKNY